MKWLILLLILAVVAAFVIVKYRRQIQTGIYLWRMFKKMRAVGAQTEKQIDRKENSAESLLVRCAKCGKWTPQNKALNLRGRTFYCSSNCLENAVKVV